MIWLRAGLFALALLTVGAGCKGTKVPAGSATDATAMGDWSSWRDLSPLVEIAESHAPESTVSAMKEASALLAQGKAKSADRRLSQEATAAGRRWIAVARADLAALHFTLCIRGVAWRLSDSQSAEATERDADYSEDVRVQPGDISVEALLTNVEDALQTQNEALQTQARIARARVAAFAQRCAANDDVAAKAQQTLESDLATLAAQGHLTPDLAYLWAGVQMNRFSGSAARPFLLQALDGGFDHPAVTFMLAVIALEERNLDEAQRLAAEAETIYRELGDDLNVAEALFVRGEVSRARGEVKAAKKHYRAALKASGQHVPSMLALAGLAVEGDGESAAVEMLHAQLPKLVLEGPLDENKARDAASNLEALVIMATEPLAAQISRDALLYQIDKEPDPMRRGLRYFYAATLDVRLREYQVAHGHGVLAKEEFAESDVPAPIDVQAFLDRLQP